MSGYGTYILSDGRKFKGEFKNDNKEGYGIFTWPDGRCF